MGFLSFCEKYYMDEVEKLDCKRLNENELYKAKQLLKLLDDLLDEGYTELNRILEEKHCIVSRLRRLLSFNKVKPFSIQHPPALCAHYGDTEIDIDALCGILTERMKDHASLISDEPLLTDLRKYCMWLSYDTEVAYVFLLRDVFLPYFYYRSSGRENLYAWVINRDFIRQMAGDGADDILRLPIYEALENDITDYAAFHAFVSSRIRAALERFPLFKAALEKLLSGIPQNRILVIESGYCGTIPLTLSALDERVDIRLYTTAPYLYNIYCDKAFCQTYENIRSFETLYSQDMLMKYASFKNGKFTVRTAVEDEIWMKSLAELNRMKP